MRTALAKSSSQATSALPIGTLCWTAVNAEQSANTPKNFKGDTLVIWNQHDGKAKDRGTEKVNLALYVGD